MKRHALFILLGLIFIAVCLAQESFLAGLGSPFDLIDIPLFFSFFAISLFQERVAFFLLLTAVLVRGFIATDFTVSIALLALGLFFLLTQLHLRFFTNRTYYAVLALSGIGWLTAIGGEYGIINAWRLAYQGLQGGILWPAWPSLVVSFLALVAFLTIAYALTVSLNKRIRSYFIVSSS